MHGRTDGIYEVNSHFSRLLTYNFHKSASIFFFFLGFVQNNTRLKFVNNIKNGHFLNYFETVCTML